MLGYSHATSGALGWLALAPVVASSTGQVMGAPELVAGAVACAGAALIPDLDHPQATIAYTFGPVSHAVARFTALAAGGHRQATHSLLFAFGFGVVCQLVSLAGTVPVMVLMFLLSAFAFRGMNIVPPGTSRAAKGFVVLLEAAGFTYALTQFMPGTWWWLGIAGFMGCVIHCMGDSLTPERVPWLWPHRGRYGFGLIEHTGNWAEKSVIGPLLTLGMLWFAWVRFSDLLGWELPDFSSWL